MKTLKLTSPPMQGPDVRQIQEAMAKHHWLHGNVDGVYGPMTAQAAYRSKYWLGYSKLNQTAGTVLLDYLRGKRPLTDAMKSRTRARQAQAAQVPVRQKALNWMSTKIGTKENPPGSNKIDWASQWYGLIGPWCAMAITRAYVEAGSVAFKRSQRYAFVPFIVHDAQAGVNHLALTHTPQPGDLACFDWNGDGNSDHVGLFVRWTDLQNGVFQSLEGNTAVGNDSNGGQCMRRERRRSQVQAFVHVGR